MGVVRQIVNLDFGARFVIEIDTDEVERRLRERLAHVLEMDGVLEAIADILRGEARRSFAEGGPGWKPLAPSTIAAKVATNLPRRNASGRIPTRLKQNGQFSAANILIREGRLRDSWVRKDHPEHIERIDPQELEVEVGSAAPYAEAHQFGVSAFTIISKSGKMRMHPGLTQRPVTISKAALTQIEELLDRHLSGEKIMRRH